MKQKIFIPLYFILTFIITGFQCYRGIDNNYGRGQYAFKENTQITPYRVDYNAGDTLWLDLTIPGKRIFDTISGSRVFYDSVNFNCTVQVDLLYNNPFVVNGPLADFIFPFGVSAFTYTGGSQTHAQISFGCAPSTDYQLQVGVILKQKGVLGISFYNSYLRKCFSNSYEPNSLTLSFNVNDTHKNLYLQQPMNSIGKVHEQVFLNMLDRKTMVAIRVL